MIHDSTPYRVLKISELARHIASQLVLIDAEKSLVNLACACRSLEEPILSTLWETQSSLYTLLGILPEENWKSHPKTQVVCGPDPQLEGLEAQTIGYFSARLWGIHHQRIGTESSDTRPGCAKSTCMSGCTSERKPSKNYTSIRLLVDGSQRCKIYLYASETSISRTPTYSSLRI